MRKSDYHVDQTHKHTAFLQFLLFCSICHFIFIRLEMAGFIS